jgi:hypothetical protein
VAVPAEEHALPGLFAGSIDPVTEAAGRKSERLLFGIEVMELQRCWRPVISADCATAAGLLDQDPLDLAAALGHTFLGAQNAPVAAAGV